VIIYYVSVQKSLAFGLMGEKSTGGHKIGKVIDKPISQAILESGNGINISMPYTTRTMVIDSNNIDHFLDVPNRRLVRPAQVQSILEDLIKGDFHCPALVLEELPKRKGYWYTIDGGHRMDGFGGYLEMNPTATIEIPVHIYPPLDDETRRHLYNRYNIPIRQTRDDMIHTYKDTLPIYPDLIAEIPCTIYGRERENMKVSHVCSCFISAKEDNEFAGGYSANPVAFVERLQRLDHSDLDDMIEFWGIFKEAFNVTDGEPLSTISETKTTPFSVLFRLWYQNKDRIDRDEIVRRFKDLKNKSLQNKPLLEEWAKRTGKAQARQCLMDVRSKINRGHPKELRFKDNY